MVRDEKDKRFIIISDFNNKTGSLIFVKNLIEGTKTEFIEDAQKFTLEFCRELGLTQAFGSNGKGYLNLDDNNFTVKTKLYVRGRNYEHTV